MNGHCKAVITSLLTLAVCIAFSPLARTSAGSIDTSVSSAGVVEMKAPDVRHYHIDAGQSTFMVHASVGGLFSSFGHNHNIAIKNISGETQFTDGTVTPASLHMKVEANSLVVTDKISDKDRQTIEQEMRDQVLETGKFPEITFNSTKIEATKKSDIYQAKIWGDLTLHGVTHNIPIDTQLTFDAKTMRARGEFSLKMSDYGIKAPSVAGGTITVKDTLKFNFNIFSQ